MSAATRYGGGCHRDLDTFGRSGLDRHQDGLPFLGARLAVASMGNACKAQAGWHQRWVWSVEESVAGGPPDLLSLLRPAVVDHARDVIADQRMETPSNWQEDAAFGRYAWTRHRADRPVPSCRSGRDVHPESAAPTASDHPPARYCALPCRWRRCWPATTWPASSANR